MVKQKVVMEVFRHAESKYSAITLLIWPLFSLNTWQFLPVFRKTTSFCVKLGNQIFPKIHPWLLPIADLHLITTRSNTCQLSCLYSERESKNSTFLWSEKEWKILPLFSPGFSSLWMEMFDSSHLSNPTALIQVFFMLVFFWVSESNNAENAAGVWI